MWALGQPLASPSANTQTRQFDGDEMPPVVEGVKNKRIV
jgi:hypothetical protein